MENSREETYLFRATIVLILCLIGFVSCSRIDWSGLSQKPVNAGGISGASDNDNSPRLEMSFEFQKQLGMSSNQFAVWIENDLGAHITTLFTTRWTARLGWKIWDVLLPDWRQAAQPETMSSDTIDAISGATPSTGRLSFMWDCRDSHGKLVAAGDYRFIVEGNLRWASRVLIKGRFSVGGSTQESIGISEYFGDDEQERTMITNVIATYYP